MSRKTEAWAREMLSGTLNLQDKPILHWSPPSMERRRPCPQCGRMTTVQGNKLEQHYAAGTTVICN